MDEVLELEALVEVEVGQLLVEGVFAEEVGRG